MNLGPFNDKQQREAFHFLFLERLLRISNPAFYILKGGVNLRFFLNSPRYSEDMDIDVLGGAVQTLKKNGYKILKDSSFLRQLKAYGIDNLLINDPTKAKQTQTTQRFRIRLVNQAGEEFPTKVEFSRRNTKSAALFISETIHPEIARSFQKISFRCQHYTGESASIQKIIALASRVELQVRDAFDLFILYSAGYFTVETKKKLNPKIYSQAAENLMIFTYQNYEGQVLEYLSANDKAQYEGQKEWKKIQGILLGLLSDG